MEVSHTLICFFLLFSLQDGSTGLVSAQRFRLIVTDGVVLYVRLTLVVLVIVSSLSVLVFCRKRTCKVKSEEPEPPVETQHDFVTETDREYDDIGEAGRSRSRPVEISSVHTHARYTRPNADETDDYYNIDTASNS
ncbi:hypothetical protein CgunFtcFv8_001132 [Champsocephalus gunnari]|uniref:Uncharacterized protein n=1 Tax=Champsocephalus gunnari TaxID=52237 RepID=A0AAN8DU41_CHAGU|nr:hypothetical protein CgunFtcFv8_001132 [Champsocephalus gunnari]